MASLLAGVCNIGSHYMQNQGGNQVKTRNKGANQQLKHNNLYTPHQF